MSGRYGAGLREVARGFRWGSRPLTPAGAERYRPRPATREFPTDWARTPAARTARSVLQSAGLKPLLWSQLDPRIEGLDVLTGLRGPVIFVSNHSSHLDAPLLLCSLPPVWRERTAVAAAADYFFDSAVRAVSTALVFSTVPIERKGGAPSATPGGLLEAGWNLVVFPEGTRSADGLQRRFRLGAAYLSMTHGVPVVPVGIRGSYAAMPRGRNWPLPGRPRVVVRYGHPVHATEGDDVRTFTARLDAAVRRLVDEDERTWWQSLQAPAGPAAALTPVAAENSSARWRRVWTATDPVATRGSGSPWQTGTSWR